MSGISGGDVKIENALISSWDKNSLKQIFDILCDSDVRIYATSGTAKYLSALGLQVTPLEKITGFGDLMGGRVKTLHTDILTGILARNNPDDISFLKKRGIPRFDLVYVELYPFSDFIDRDENESVEMIDIGGVTLLRAGAKNFSRVLTIPGKNFINVLKNVKERGFISTIAERREMALTTFAYTSLYDMKIIEYFAGRISTINNCFVKMLRYGENPHQKGMIVGNISRFMRVVHAPRELSYNNILDIESGVFLVKELKDVNTSLCVSVIIKHNNPCGVGIDADPSLSLKKAFDSDPVSSYGGILVTSFIIDKSIASFLKDKFLDCVACPSFDEGGLQLLSSSKRKILVECKFPDAKWSYRSIFNDCFLLQTWDYLTDFYSNFEVKVSFIDIRDRMGDIRNAWIIAKHCRSNAIVLFRDGMMVGVGCGNTSRVDAAKEAMRKAVERGHNTYGCVLASDGFLPFADTVELAHKHGISIIIQPGGSIRDSEVESACIKYGITLIHTGIRHFKH